MINMDDVSNLAPGVLLIVIIFVLIWWFNKSAKADKKAAEERVIKASEEVKAFIEQVNVSMKFEPISINLNLQNDEFAVLAEVATLYEYRTQRISTGVGTRVKIGGLPLYLGRSISQSEDKLKKVTQGMIYLTNKRIVFVGDNKNVTTALKDIVSVENALDHITVNSSKRQKPEIFTTKNGFYWGCLTQALTKMQLTSPVITSHIVLTD